MTGDLLKGCRAIGRHIGESEATARDMCARGDIPAFRLGPRWAMRASDYDAFIEKKARDAMTRAEMAQDHVARETEASNARH